MFSDLSTFHYFALSSCFISTVLGHGYVHSITLDGVTYQGADPYGPAISSPIRQVSSNSPAAPGYGNLNGPAVACGGDAKPASMTVPVLAGSNVTISWGKWPHNVGPIITYLGACNGPCESTDPTTIDFFKIDQVDFVPGTKDWVQAETLYLGKPYTFTLPFDVPPGDFIMRHEVIALHNAMNPGGAELYPQCIQISIDCGLGVIPKETVRFPGGYKATDPGLLINVYDDPGSLMYTFAGPEISLKEDPALDADAQESTLPASSTSVTTASPTASSTSSVVASTTSSRRTSSGMSTRRVTSSTTPFPTSTPPPPSSTSSRRRTSSTSAASTGQRSSSSTPIPSFVPELNPIELQNGRDALALNRQFTNVVAGSSCNNYDIGCAGDAFAQCLWGKWVTTKCPVTTVCAALPNVGMAGTSIACTTPFDRDARIAATGATLRMRRRKRRTSRSHL